MAFKAVKLPKDYEPSEDEDYMNAKQLTWFQQKLVAWRDELIKESQETINNLKEENWREPDLSDRASLETEAGVELRTRNRYLKLIGKIDSTLRRLDEGEFGYCEETGDPIGIRRLKARPIATMTIEAQERHEKLEKQYTDEE